MRLVIKDKRQTEPEIGFSLEQDDNQVNILANGDLIGWFREDGTSGKIVFVRSFPVRNDTKAAIDVEKVDHMFLLKVLNV